MTTVTNAYNSIPVSSRITNLMYMPQASAHTLNGLYREQNGTPLKLIDAFPLNRNEPLMGRHQFCIGYYNTIYEGWTRMTKRQWTDKFFQEELLREHAEHKGWLLLDDSIITRTSLAVKEGLVKIDDKSIISSNQTLFTNSKIRGVYSAKFIPGNKLWKKEPPAVGENWTVSVADLSDNAPCLFYRQKPSLGAAEAVGGSSRRSRRHKRSKRVKKQKKRTRKH